MSIFGNSIKTGIEEFPDAPLLSYGLFRDGLWVRSKEPLGTFYRKVSDNPTDLGLTKDFGGFHFEPSADIPKIPVGIYHAIVEFYRAVCKVHTAEVYSMVFWDKELEDFVIHVPEQTIGYASVKYKKDSGMFLDSRYIPVLESHSHNTFSSFFSATDLKDEIASRYFAVFGNLDKENNDFVVRVASNGQEKRLTLQDVFDVEKLKHKPDSDYTVDADEAMSRLSVIKPAVSKLYAGKSYTGYGVATDLKDTSFPAKTSSALGVYHEGGDSDDVYDFQSYGNYHYTHSSFSAYSTLIYDIARLRNTKEYNPELLTNLGESVAAFIDTKMTEWDKSPTVELSLTDVLIEFDQGVADYIVANEAQ